MEPEQLKLPHMEQIDFVIRGLQVSVQHEKLKREQAIEDFKRWFPEAEELPIKEPGDL